MAVECVRWMIVGNMATNIEGKIQVSHANANLLPLVVSLASTAGKALSHLSEGSYCVLVRNHPEFLCLHSI